MTERAADESTGRASAGSGPQIVMQQERELAIAHWLLGAAPDVTQSRWEWAQDSETFLRCGGLFTAVRIPSVIVRAATGAQDPSLVDRVLAEALDGGPVIATYGRNLYYALVPSSTGRHWQEPSAECLVNRTLLGVPPVGRNTYDGGRPYWAVPMDGPAELCMPEDVKRFVRHALLRWQDSEFPR
ncbi:hypothetical protein ABT255_03665 [Streptomyces mirabilis]|uniref:hypothetical protein n=1 Tax=Streptomyces mirabilis TaxID=68239 RepID=UPI00332E5DCB